MFFEFDAWKYAPSANDIFLIALDIRRLYDPFNRFQYTINVCLLSEEAPENQMDPYWCLRFAGVWCSLQVAQLHPA